MAVVATSCEASLERAELNASRFPPVCTVLVRCDVDQDIRLLRKKLIIFHNLIYHFDIYGFNFNRRVFCKGFFAKRK